MNILFLADPNSIHDITWIKAADNTHAKFLIYRSIHKPKNSINSNITALQAISNFSVINIVRTLLDLIKLRSKILKHEIDIFHILYAEPNALWTFIKYFVPVKVIITCRGTDILKTIPDHFNVNSIQNYYVRKLYRLAFKNADKVTCTSERQVQNAFSLFGIKFSEIIRTGIDFKEIDRFIKGTVSARLKDKKYVFFPRNMKPIYNHELSIKAINLLPKKILKEYVFVFIDRDGQAKEYISLILKLMDNTSANFAFLPRLNSNELIPLYRKSTLVVHTPISDGSPVSAMEAMYCKIPVVLPNLGYDETIFKYCLYYHSGDKIDLSNQILKALQSDVSKYIKLSFDLVKQYADREKEMKKINKLYLELANTEN